MAAAEKARGSAEEGSADGNGFVPATAEEAPNKTVLGKVLWQLRDAGLESDDEFTRYHAQRSLVPDRQIHLREENPRVFESFSLQRK